MDKIKLGILGASDIAFRRFLPALKGLPDIFAYAGVASRDVKKASHFKEDFGGVIYDGYDALLNDDSIKAVYIPLPPALHYEWGEKALLKGKHVFLEKPSTTSSEATKKLITLAKERNLALYENYMFIHHNQLKTIKEIIANGDIGDLRLMRANFSFPKRDATDFRYNKALGGGALLDCGGYPLRLAYEMLGESIKCISSNLSYTDEFEVDVFGSASFTNASGLVFQLAFGMDNSYQCNLEVFGSKGYLLAPRIFTMPADLDANIYISIDGEKKEIIVDKHDQFKASIAHFYSCISNKQIREKTYKDLQIQANLVDKIQNNK